MQHPGFISLRQPFRAGLVLVLAIAVAGCQTAGGPGASGPTTSKWAVDEVVQKCTASIVGGALVGALLGAVTGDGRNAVKGAMIGGVAGVGLGAVALALNAEDRKNIREAQLKAAMTNEPQTLAYVGTDGLKRQIEIRPTKTITKTRPPQEPADTKPVAEAKPASEASPQPTAPETPAPGATEQPASVETPTKPGARLEANYICREIETNASVETKGATAIPTETLCQEQDGTFAPHSMASKGA